MSSEIILRYTARIPDVRSELFGFSIISIILFHYCEDVQSAGFGGAAAVLATGYNLLLGSSGVEIFLFLSGMGLYFSLSGDNRLSVFYRKRLTRILPVYLLFGGVGFAVLDLLLRHEGWQKFLLDFSMISFWTEGTRLVWYIALILPLYLLFPLLYRLISVPDRRLAGALTAALSAAVIAGCLTLRFIYPDVYDNIEIALWRVVPFILGAWYGRKARNGESFSFEAVLLCILAVCFALLCIVTRLYPDFMFGIFSLRFGALFYPYIMLFAATAIISRFGGSRFLRSVGSVTLELYLSHVILRAVMNEIGLKTCYPHFYLLCIAVSVALSFAVHKLQNIFALRIINKNKKL